ncbi:MAG: PmoA family protein [Bryobacteraceae bacterium]|nr:PmoA family protein [Bryobacteraceae bacterium]
MTRRSILFTPLAARAAAAAGGPRLEHKTGEKVSFLYGDRLLFEYRYTRAKPKSYVHPLCSPDGTPLTLDSPHDHVHHRGLMLAWSDVNGYDFWGEENPGRHGKIVFERFDQIHGRAPLSIASVEHWVADGEVLLVERRTIRAPRISPDAVRLEWTSELTAQGKPVVLSAKGHEYNGLGIRFARGMDGGSVLNAAGENDIAKANGQAAEWCAYTGGDGKGGSAGVAIAEGPENSRRPTPFFVMNQPFGYLSAAPTFREPLELKPGQSLTLRYHVITFAGPAEAERINKLIAGLRKK